MILKLGPKKKHHAAHHPGEDACLATQPESALHISVKCYIADELRRAGQMKLPLIFVEHCLVGRRELLATEGTSSPHELSSSPCEECRQHLAALTWDDVILERRIAGRDADGDSTIARTPDIVLMKAGVPILAIEVFVTHRVDQIKAEALATLGVPWAEIRADSSLFEGDPWKCDAPLPVVRRGGRGQWRCPDHQKEHEEWLAEDARRREYDAREQEARIARAAERDKRQRELLERLQAISTTYRSARVVDFYMPNGLRRRRYYFVAEDNSGHAERHIALIEAESTIASWVVDFESEESKQRVWQALRDAWRNDCHDLQREEGSAMDSPMRWLHGPLAETIARLVQIRTRENARVLTDAFPPRLEFHGGVWRFCRRGFEDLRWDGQEGEGLRAHPDVPRS